MILSRPVPNLSQSQIWPDRLVLDRDISVSAACKNMNQHMSCLLVAARAIIIS